VRAPAVARLEARGRWVEADVDREPHALKMGGGEDMLTSFRYVDNKSIHFFAISALQVGATW
jgi:hypothetical protein